MRILLSLKFKLSGARVSNTLITFDEITKVVNLKTTAHLYNSLFNIVFCVNDKYYFTVIG